MTLLHSGTVIAGAPLDSGALRAALSPKVLAVASSASDPRGKPGLGCCAVVEPREADDDVARPRYPTESTAHRARPGGRPSGRA